LVNQSCGAGKQQLIPHDSATPITARTRWRAQGFALIFCENREGHGGKLAVTFVPITAAMYFSTAAPRLSIVAQEGRQFELSQVMREQNLRLIDYNGSIEVHSSLLNVVLHDEPHINT
jgi:hypothetical protein